MVSSSAIIRIDRSREADSLPLMLRPLLFSPAAVWLVRALQEAGVERFLLLTHADLAEQAAPCFPEGTQVCFLDDGGVDEAIRAFAAQEPGKKIISVTEPVWLSFTAAGMLAQDDRVPLSDDDLSGIFRVNANLLAEKGSLDMLSRGKALDLEDEDALPLVFPLDDMFDFVEAESLAKTEQVSRLIAKGVRVLDPQSVYMDPTVTVGAGTLLLPGVILRGETHIGENCEIGPNTMIRDCVLGDGCVANSSQLNEAVFGRNVNIGPYAYVRPGTRVADNCKVGDFVEVKNAVIGEGTKLPHLIYVGDSDVGARCNFGCGSITCNYDGQNKHRTTVGDDVFIGCNTNLVAPVTVQSGAFTAAGSTITDTVPADALAIARARQVNREGWQRPKKLQK